ncbi:MAG: sigma-70 family RNA polymerase sigma factor [Polyangiaceae bacterium]|nr:sigma-70 family RNA polymerase sigma factor [Polyangiaceae bacterium]
MSETTTQAGRKLLGTAEIRKMLSDYIRRRVPESDVDDVVQTVLVEALASERVPDDKSELRKWLTGVARHKIADHHRRAGRERPAELPEIETQPAPIEEQELARWAEKQARTSKEGDATLRWMAREGEGDKLEHIAAEEKLPAATVRQRVSRMRRWMKERWLAEVAAAAAILGILVFLVYKLVAVPPKGPVVEKEVSPPVAPSPAPTGRVAPSPLERAAELRREALRTCEAEPKACIDKLDEAKRLDPAGDASREVQGARRAAEQQLEPQQQQSPPAPTSTNEPPPTPTGDQKVAPPPTATPIAPPTFTAPPKGPSKEAPKAPSKEAPTKPAPKSDMTGSDFSGSQSTSAPPAPTSAAQSPQTSTPQPQAPPTSFESKGGKPSFKK